MKQFFFKISAFGLVCFLSACNGCWTPMPVVSCGGLKTKSNVDSYIKKDIPHEKKILDIQECLGDDYSENIPTKGGNIFTPLRKKYNDEIRGDIRISNFDSCMKDKGYIFYEKIDGISNQ
ncbi:hypothetical protein [Paralysiella testudinis]|uniref:Lipoprotein n=1 Tax=Paralysiella testudinis TaxID=2809020 RepID=A0A892ZCB3_9NEIS|nr:hypothetical protein [Paralysiella testudinis]QRQ80935.1 hypothetical protein JQU52_09320 [Paralysiella testudinis]